MFGMTYYMPCGIQGLKARIISAQCEAKRSVGEKGRIPSGGLKA
ncbi:hypothetical protein [Tannerella forsythia]|nr:hypothetical protein [Tannerella forsythia]